MLYCAFQETKKERKQEKKKARKQEIFLI